MASNKLFPAAPNRLMPDTLDDGAPDPDATAGWQQLYRDWQARGAAMPPLTEWLRGAGSEYANALLMGSTAPAGRVMRAFHGSPHSFDRFSLDAIGTGEGAQAFGRGLYFAENEGVAQGYRDALAGVQLKFPSKAAEQLFNGLPTSHRANIQGMLERGAPPAEIRATLKNLADGARSHAAYVQSGGRPSVDYGEGHGAAAADAAEQLAGLRTMPKAVPAGHMYEVNLDIGPHEMLDWDKPLSEQHPDVMDAVHRVARHPDFAAQRIADDTRPIELRGLLQSPEAIEALNQHGVKGIRYLDRGSRTGGSGTSNIVAFDPATIEIIRKYGLAGLGLGTAAAAADGQ